MAENAKNTQVSSKTPRGSDKLVGVAGLVVFNGPFVENKTKVKQSMRNDGVKISHLQTGYDNSTTWYIDFTGKTRLNMTQLKKVFAKIGKIRYSDFEVM